MKTRILLGSLMIGAIAGLFALDHQLDVRWSIGTLIALLGVGGWIELARMAGIHDSERGGGWILFLVGLVGTGFFLGLAWWEEAVGRNAPHLTIWGLFVTVFSSFAVVVGKRSYEKSLSVATMTICGVLLFGFLFSYTLRIYHHPDGLLRAVVFVLGVKGTDIFAYFGGRAFGRTRFLKVSPNKTLEGCLSGMVFTTLWLVVASVLYPDVFFPWPQAIGLGIILSVTSQIGDLSESLLKRFYDVKDSGHLLPEFGGVLDLIDSVLFSGFLFFWSCGA